MTVDRWWYILGDMWKCKQKRRSLGRLTDFRLAEDLSSERVEGWKVAINSTAEQLIRFVSSVVFEQQSSL